MHWPTIRRPKWGLRCEPAKYLKMDWSNLLPTASNTFPPWNSRWSNIKWTGLGVTPWSPGLMGWLSVTLFLLRLQESVPLSSTGFQTTTNHCPSSRPSFWLVTKGVPRKRTKELYLSLYPTVTIKFVCIILVSYMNRVHQENPIF